MLLEKLEIYIPDDKVTAEEAQFLTLLNTATKDTKFIYASQTIIFGDEIDKLKAPSVYKYVHENLYLSEMKELSKFKYKFKKTPWHDDIIGIVDDTTKNIATISLLRLSNILNCIDDNTNTKKKESLMCNLRNKFFSHLWESDNFLALEIQDFTTVEHRFVTVYNHAKMCLDKSKYNDFLGNPLYILSNSEKENNVSALSSQNKVEPWEGFIFYNNPKLYNLFYIAPSELQEYYLTFIKTLCERDWTYPIVYINKRTIKQDRVKLIESLDHNNMSLRKQKMNFWFSSDDTVDDDLIGVVKPNVNGQDYCFL